MTEIVHDFQKSGSARDNFAYSFFWVRAGKIGVASSRYYYTFVTGNEPYLDGTLADYIN